MNSTQQLMAELELTAVMALRTLDCVGATTVTHDQIEKFCGHCDYKDNPQVCPRKDQARCVFRDSCGWSSRNGARISEVSASEIRVGDVSYPRSDMSAIDAVLTRNNDPQ